MKNIKNCSVIYSAIITDSDLSHLKRSLLFYDSITTINQKVEPHGEWEKEYDLWLKCGAIKFYSLPTEDDCNDILWHYTQLMIRDPEIGDEHPTSYPGYVPYKYMMRYKAQCLNEANDDTIFIPFIEEPSISEKKSIRIVKNRNLSEPNTSEKYDIDVKAQSNVFQIIFNQMPLIHPETPLEHILEFREHPENKYWLLLLRTWINKMKHQNNETKELLQEIESGIMSIKKSLSRKKINYTIGFYGATILSPITETIKFVSSTLFSVNKINTQLTEDEMSIQGRELSYLIKAKNAFNPS
jgi:hypothetical protein